MEHPASAIARDLAGQAERLCRRYLSNGRREGNYWQVGDVRNTPGRSLYVRLRDSPDGTGRAGKWTDAESGEHGDLLDIIRASTLTGTLSEALAEARRFLSLPDSPVSADRKTARNGPTGSPGAARRLLAICKSISGTQVETYLRGRGIPPMSGLEALHFHPRCWYRRSIDDRGDVPPAMPAMIATVTDTAGTITGAHRTWLTPNGSDKAPVAYPRRAMGHLLGHGVRFGTAAPVMAAGEGIESTLSLFAAVPTLPAIAALSSAHLAALAFPPTLRRLYVAREADPAGRKAFITLAHRAIQCGIDVRPLDSELGDLNADLQTFGLDAMRAHLLAQMVAEDRP
ncbi:MAG: DNA primase [Sphingomonas sp. 28-66-16]|nr:MAG: DNA primase [Sphingomonas sp. 28-66-16]